MAEILNPISGNRRFRSYLTQFSATSGRVPSAAILDEIIQNELEASRRQQIVNREIAERQRQFDIGQATIRDIERERQKGATQGAIGNIVTQAPVDYYIGKELGLWGGKTAPELVSKTIVPSQFSTAGGSLPSTVTTAGETTLGSSTIPLTSGTPVVSGVGPVASQLAPGTNVAINAGGTAGTTGTAGTSSLGSVAGPVAIAAAADFIRRAGGGVDKPWEDRSTAEKMMASPGAILGTGGLAPLGYSLGESNALGKAANWMGKTEEKLVGRPLDKFFSGDIPGGLESMWEGISDVFGF